MLSHFACKNKTEGRKPRHQVNSLLQNRKSKHLANYLMVKRFLLLCQFLQDCCPSRSFSCKYSRGKTLKGICGCKGQHYSHLTPLIKLSPVSWPVLGIMRITESKNLRMVWDGRVPKNHRVSMSHHGQGHLCQGLSTITGKSFFPISNLTLACVSLKPFPCVLAFQAIFQNPPGAPLGAGWGSEVSPEPPLLQLRIPSSPQTSFPSHWRRAHTPVCNTREFTSLILSLGLSAAKFYNIRRQSWSLFTLQH